MNATQPQSQTSTFYQENPFVLPVHKGCRVFKYDIAKVLDFVRFDQLLRTLLDSDPELAETQSMDAAKSRQKWVSVELAEIIVLKWVGHGDAQVQFSPQAVLKKK